MKIMTMLVILITSIQVLYAQYIGDLKITAPLGGTYNAGSQMTVSWVSSNVPPDANITIWIRPIDLCSEVGGYLLTKTNNCGNILVDIPFDREEGDYEIEMVWWNGLPDVFTAYTMGGLFHIHQREMEITGFQIRAGTNSITYTGGADGAVSEIVASTNLTHWQRTGIFVTNNLATWPTGVDANKFFRVASLLPLKLELGQIPNNVTNGSSVPLTATISGRTCTYVSYWWVEDPDGACQILNNIYSNGQCNDSWTFNKVGKWTVGCMAFGDNYRLAHTNFSIIVN